MSVESCSRCGQLLLPEIVRELGDGRRCPFCNADLRVDARASSNNAPHPPAPEPARRLGGGLPHASAPARAPMPPQPPARRPAPAAPSARPAALAAPTLIGMSAARTQTAAAAAVVLSPPAAEPERTPAPVPALARTPEPRTAPDSLRVPLSRPREASERQPLAPLFALPPSSPTWLDGLRRRPWLAAPVVLAAITTIATIGLLARHRPSAVVRPAVAVPSATPLPPAPPAEATPDVADRLAAADSPVATKEAASATGSSRAATGPAKAGGRSHAKRRAHHQKRRAAHANHNKHRHAREIALESAPAPKAAGDESSARSSYERGNQRLLTGDTAGAISAYEEAVRAAPSSPSGYRGLGLAYEKAGKQGEAVRAFRHYLKLAPSSDDRDLVTRRLRHLVRAGGESSK